MMCLVMYFLVYLIRNVLIFLNLKIYLFYPTEEIFSQYFSIFFSLYLHSQSQPHVYQVWVCFYLSSPGLTLFPTIIKSNLSYILLECINHFFILSCQDLDQNYVRYSQSSMLLNFHLIFSTSFSLLHSREYSESVLSTNSLVFPLAVLWLPTDYFYVWKMWFSF